jgi:hypothetical protein
MAGNQGFSFINGYVVRTAAVWKDDFDLFCDSYAFGGSRR